jgi:hypothetical protein
VYEHLQDPFVSQNLIRMLAEDLKDFELSRAQNNFDIANEHSVHRLVDGEIADEDSALG